MVGVVSTTAFYAIARNGSLVGNMSLIVVLHAAVILSVLLPLAYGFGRASGSRKQWLLGIGTIAVLLSLPVHRSLTVPPAFLTFDFFAPGFESYFENSLHELAIWISLGSWAAVPLYLLGRASQPTDRTNRGPLTPERTVGATVLLLLTVFIAVSEAYIVPPVTPYLALLDAVLFGPFLYAILWTFGALRQQVDGVLSSA